MNLPRHKLAALVYLSILPLVWFLLPLMRQVLSDWPNWLTVIVTTAVLVLLMVYAAIPVMMRLLRFWLAGDRPADDSGPPAS